jgi:hypothetical protein
MFVPQEDVDSFMAQYGTESKKGGGVSILYAPNQTVFIAGLINSSYIYRRIWTKIGTKQAADG